ncbi:hypothetical protein FC26_GL000986 [Paucilactobacillus vaccinostercus DSM 20634]|uniref:Uncharacterized protein n=1 Tax=Paucilactobacillus vaccinostercus DSM 20634 TaxID=1423813 RepID=A0A0R2A124_9LACO|nr:hypothetical protein [Paucilactobacillus vaccinostercus]KRM60266.1 hypothetical protein FC26_GL000986 [Paucilactobacillus vaccinostercus DSM 20634]
MLFSKMYHVNDNTFFDPNLNHDQVKFIDPNKLVAIRTHGFNGDAVDKNYYAFFNALCETYLNDNTQLAHQLLAVPHEENGTRIGYAKAPNKGRGVSPQILDHTMQTIMVSPVNLEQVKHHPEVLSLFAQNFDRDRLSDLITSINCLELVRYTEYICNRYYVPMVPGIEITYFDCICLQWKKRQVALPTDQAGRRIILIPNGAVVDGYIFSAGSFVQKKLLTSRQRFYEEQGHPLTKKKIRAREVQPLGPGMTKQYALQQVLQNPFLLDEYLNLLRLTA